MKKPALLGTLVACACGCGLGSLEIEVQPDGSGSVTLARSDTDTSLGTMPAGIRGVTRVEQLRFGLQSDEYSFADVRQLAIDGLRLKWTRGPGAAVTLAVTLDMKPTTFWFKRLGITLEKVKQNQASLRDFLKRLARDPDSQMLLGMLGGADAEHAAGQIVVNVKLRGTGESQRLQVRQPAKLPPGWTLDRDGKHGSSGLKIPAEAILSGQAAPVVLVATAKVAPATQPAKPAAGR